MREAFFILLVLFVLLALTAIRYRKQIAGMIGLARMLRQARRSAAAGKRSVSGAGEVGVQLVNCSKCDIWVPQNRAVKFRDGFVCSSICSKAEQAAEPVHRV